MSMVIEQAPAPTALAETGASGSTPTREELTEIAARIDGRFADEPELVARLRILREMVDGRITFSTSLGLEDQAVTHALAESGIRADVFTLDTGRHFAETLDTLEATQARYADSLGRIVVMYPDAEALQELVARDGINGFRASVAARKACCGVRKVEPLKRALAGAQVWITGLRRGQSQGRTEIPFAASDGESGTIKVNPIADWSVETLEAFVADRHVPVNPLHGQGFPSIGCGPCTRAVAPGEDIRAGRWWWENEDGKECGLHSPNRPANRTGTPVVAITTNGN